MTIELNPTSATPSDMDAALPIIEGSRYPKGQSSQKPGAMKPTGIRSSDLAARVAGAPTAAKKKDSYGLFLNKLFVTRWLDEFHAKASTPRIVGNEREKLDEAFKQWRERMYGKDCVPTKLTVSEADSNIKDMVNAWCGRFHAHEGLGEAAFVDGQKKDTGDHVSSASVAAAGVAGATSPSTDGTAIAQAKAPPKPPRVDATKANARDGSAPDPIQNHAVIPPARRLSWPVTGEGGAKEEEDERWERAEKRARAWAPDLSDGAQEAEATSQTPKIEKTSLLSPTVEPGFPDGSQASAVLLDRALPLANTSAQEGVIPVLVSSPMSPTPSSSTEYDRTQNALAAQREYGEHLHTLKQKGEAWSLQFNSRWKPQENGAVVPPTSLPDAPIPQKISGENAGQNNQVDGETMAELKSPTLVLEILKSLNAVAASTLPEEKMAGETATCEGTVSEEAANLEVISAEAISEESINPEAANSETLSVEEISEETIDAKAIKEGLINAEAIDEEAIDEEAIDEEAIAAKVGNEETFSVEEISEETIDAKVIKGEVVNEKAINAKVNEEEAASGVAEQAETAFVEQRDANAGAQIDALVPPAPILVEQQTAVFTPPARAPAPAGQKLLHDADHEPRIIALSPPPAPFMEPQTRVFSPPVATPEPESAAPQSEARIARSVSATAEKPPAAAAQKVAFGRGVPRESTPSRPLTFASSPARTTLREKAFILRKEASASLPGLNKSQTGPQTTNQRTSVLAKQAPPPWQLSSQTRHKPPFYIKNTNSGLPPRKLRTEFSESVPDSPRQSSKAFRTSEEFDTLLGRSPFPSDKLKESDSPKDNFADGFDAAGADVVPGLTHDNLASRLALPVSLNDSRTKSALMFDDLAALQDALAPILSLKEAKWVLGNGAEDDLPSSVVSDDSLSSQDDFLDQKSPIHDEYGLPLVVEPDNILAWSNGYEQRMQSRLDSGPLNFSAASNELSVLPLAEDNELSAAEGRFVYQQLRGILSMPEMQRGHAVEKMTLTTSPPPIRKSNVTALPQAKASIQATGLPQLKTIARPMPPGMTALSPDARGVVLNARATRGSLWKNVPVFAPSDRQIKQEANRTTSRTQVKAPLTLPEVPATSLRSPRSLGVIREGVTSDRKMKPSKFVPVPLSTSVSEQASAIGKEPGAVSEQLLTARKQFNAFKERIAAAKAQNASGQPRIAAPQSVSDPLQRTESDSSVRPPAGPTVTSPKAKWTGPMLGSRSPSPDDRDDFLENESDEILVWSDEEGEFRTGPRPVEMMNPPKAPRQNAGKKLEFIRATAEVPEGAIKFLNDSFDSGIDLEFLSRRLGNRPPSPDSESAFFNEIASPITRGSSDDEVFSVGSDEDGGEIRRHRYRVRAMNGYSTPRPLSFQAPEY